MTANANFEEINQSKANFGKVYDEPDPRPYFETLGAFDYVIPGEAKPIFTSVIDTLREFRNVDQLKVIDVGCSYGVNAALLKHDLELEDLYRHFTESKELTGHEALAHDADFFAQHPADPSLEIVGIDVAESAVRYATDVGLLDNGIACDLEGGGLTPGIEKALTGTDLVISTGCVGYVSESTFENIISAQNELSHPWIASFVLRMFPYDNIESRLDEHGLVTERLEGHYFTQRLFADRQERERALMEIERLGLDPTPEYDDNCYYAAFYLSRPAEEVRKRPLTTILADVV